MIEADNRVSREELVNLKNRVNAAAKPIFNNLTISRKRMCDKDASSASSYPMEKTKKKRVAPPVTSTPVSEQSSR